MSMLEALSRMPGIVILIVSGLTVIGGFAGGTIGYFASRKTQQKTERAQDRLVDTLEKTCERLTTEKEDYRTRLHECRDARQATELQLKEAQSRPDVAELMRFVADEAKRRDDFDLQKAGTLAALSGNMNALAENMKKLETLI